LKVWYGAVLRGDKNKVKVGFKSNVQDRAVISCTSEVETGFSADVDIGNFVTIGHGAVLTSCTIGDETLIGQGSMHSRK
jgi:carbonic anhydrase/acetyltransferase-like protein (isoleucine patch superfamily)